jgi:hypothetical protein
MLSNLKIGSGQSESVHEALTEIEPPKLDGNSKDPGYLNINTPQETPRGC